MQYWSHQSTAICLRQDQGSCAWSSISGGFFQAVWKYADSHYHVQNPKGNPMVGAFVANGGNSKKFQIRCAFCEEPHYSALCESVVGSKDRKSILQKSKRFFNHLHIGHNMQTHIETRKSVVIVMVGITSLSVQR